MYRNREMYREFPRFLIHLREGGAEMYRLDLKCIEQVNCMESMWSAVHARGGCIVQFGMRHQGAGRGNEKVRAIGRFPGNSTNPLSDR